MEQQPRASAQHDRLNGAKIASFLIFLAVSAAAGAADSMLSFEAVESACRKRYDIEFGQGLCWGYISGLIDANIIMLNRDGRRVICVDSSADKDKVIDRILSFTDTPKDKRSGAVPFVTLGIMKALACK